MGELDSLLGEITEMDIQRSCIYPPLMNPVPLHSPPPPSDVMVQVRNLEITEKDIQLLHHEEAFTSEHWIVRIYRVKDLDNRA